MTLYIDTSEFGKVFFALVSAKKTIKRSYIVKPSETHKILELLDKFLKQSKILNPKSEIRKLVVCKGPGSFTGTRIGLALSRAMSMALGVPAKYLSKEKFLKQF